MLDSVEVADHQSDVVYQNVSYCPSTVSESILPYHRDVAVDRGAVVVVAGAAVGSSVVGIPPDHCCYCSLSSLSWLEVDHCCHCLLLLSSSDLTCSDLSYDLEPCPASPHHPQTRTLSWGRGWGSCQTHQVWGRAPP